VYAFNNIIMFRHFYYIDNITLIHTQETTHHFKQITWKVVD